jgi:hypothetical protein
MSTTMQDADTEVVSGVIQGIVQKGPDKWQVEVNVGQQNPRRLWTKDQSLVQQLSTMIGQQQSFLCGKSHWTNQSGQPVTSLWINGVGPGFQQQQPQAPPQPQWPQQTPMPMPMQAPMPPPQQPTVVQPVVTMQGPRLSDEEREDRIMRQTASKVAAILISHIPAEQRTLDNVVILSERLLAYYRGGMGTNGQPQQQQNQWADHPDYAGDPGPQGIPVTQGDFPQGY